jgi:hypothetical protein
MTSRLKFKLMVTLLGDLLVKYVSTWTWRQLEYEDPNDSQWWWFRGVENVQRIASQRSFAVSDQTTFLTVPTSHRPAHHCNGRCSSVGNIKAEQHRTRTPKGSGTETRLLRPENGDPARSEVTHMSHITCRLPWLSSVFQVTDRLGIGSLWLW